MKQIIDLLQEFMLEEDIPIKLRKLYSASIIELLGKGKIASKGWVSAFDEYNDIRKKEQENPKKNMWSVLSKDE